MYNGRTSIIRFVQPIKEPRCYRAYCAYCFTVGSNSSNIPASIPGYCVVLALTYVPAYSTAVTSRAFFDCRTKTLLCTAYCTPCSLAQHAHHVVQRACWTHGSNCPPRLTNFYCCIALTCIVPKKSLHPAGRRTTTPPYYFRSARPGGRPAYWPARTAIRTETWHLHVGSIDGRNFEHSLSVPRWSLFIVDPYSAAVVISGQHSWAS